MTRCGRIYPIHSDTCLSWAALLWQRLQQLISAWSEPQTLTWCKKVNKCRQKSQQTQNCQTSWPHLTGDLAQADNRRMHISLEYGCNSLVIPFITWSTDSAVIVTVLWVYSKGTYLRAFKCFQRFHRNTWRNLSVRFCRCLRLSENLTETGPPNNLTKSTVDQQVTARKATTRPGVKHLLSMVKAARNPRFLATYLCHFDIQGVLQGAVVASCTNKIQQKYLETLPQS